MAKHKIYEPSSFYSMEGKKTVRDLLNTHTGNNIFSLLLSEETKYANDKEVIKQLVMYYERIGRLQTSQKLKKYERLYNLAYGVINPEDYFSEEVQEFLNPTGMGSRGLEDVKLKYFPIVPNIINAIKNQADKQVHEVYAQAINSEATNEIIDLKNKELQSILVEQLQNKFEAGLDPNLTDEQKNEEFDMFQKSAEVQEKYTKKFRFNVELWANHVIQVDHERFNLDSIGRKVIEEIAITNHPYVHVNFIGDKYYPENLESKRCFYLKSPFTEDVSEATMFGWFSEANIGTIISQYGSLLKEKDIEKLVSWNGFTTSSFIPNNQTKHFTGANTDTIDSAINLMTLRQLADAPNRHPDTLHQTIFTVTNMYMLLPRKAGILTYKSGDTFFQTKVDENAKITYKPIYSTNKKEEQNEVTLIEGEHIEWFYYNELWKCVKITRHNAGHFVSPNQSGDSEPIYVFLDKHPVQYKGNGVKFGIRIPVHGGPESNLHNKSLSIAEKTENFQIMYNFLWNKNELLLSSEIGKFLMFPQNELPNESMGESWSKNPLRAFQVAKDISLLPMDRSVTNLGQASSGSAGFGQVVDLTKTTEIMEKAQLAAFIKNECYLSVGITPEQLGEMSPYQSTASVKQGLQRSNNQIQHLFTRQGEIMKRLIGTMLETAQYLAARDGLVEINNVISEEERAIFQMESKDFDLYDLGIFLRNKQKDIVALEVMNEILRYDNTLQLTGIEKLSLLNLPSPVEIMNKVKEIKADQDKKLQEKYKHEQDLQQQQIEARKAELDAEIKRQEKQDELDRENQIAVAQIKALGYANDNASSISQEILALQTANSKQRELYNREQLAEAAHQLSQNKLTTDALNTSTAQRNEMNIKSKELALREQEIRATENRTKAMLEEKKNNKSN